MPLFFGNHTILASYHILVNILIKQPFIIVIDKRYLSIVFCIWILQF